jgi:GTP-binding protein Era
MANKFAYIGIAGKPNVGKSTLINQLVGEKIAITSSKAQTTRHRILGVKHGEDYQYVFVDTPGLHVPKFELNKMIVKTAETALLDMDMIMWVVDRKKSISDDAIYHRLKSLHVPIILVINKIDQLENKSKIDDIIISYLSLGNFDAVIPISAKEKTYLEPLLDSIKSFSKDGDPLFPKDYITDQTEKQTISEWIREKILYETEQEIPHACAVVVEHIEENQKHKTLDIRALIIVETPSQKKILIGKQGEKLKTIGTKARLDLKKTLAYAIHLELWVKVKKDWRNKPEDIQSLGYREDTWKV